MSTALRGSTRAHPSPIAHDLPQPAGAPRNSPADLVGHTPVLRIAEPLCPAPRGFWAKLEGANPGGIKDRPALHMVAAARTRGQLTPGATIVESTSGTMGLGLALAGATYGHPVVLVTDPGIEPLMLHQLRALGARVETVAEPHPLGGWQEARRTRVRELLRDVPGAWCPDQYNNPDNAAAYTGLALELVFQLGRIDTLVAAVGTGGHSAGTARALRKFFPDMRLVGVDSIRSTIFGQSAGPRLMRGLGSSIHPGNVDHAAFDEVHWVAPHEAVWTCRRLARHNCPSGGWSVGAVSLVAGWLARTQPPGDRIAAIFPDGMPRYWDTVYSDDYCRSHDLLDRCPARQPDEIATQQERTVERWTRCTSVTPPPGSPAGRPATNTSEAAR
ncbi:PLP-dependent cysteine synthase family protein [Kitasatospora sp. NPDC098652]|uniref:PLP-dependent cysteine synthase family protein n=1 Tax=Kitasatospora sp. NPDC098652 TaxID=3364095 RepID=UPI003819CF13